ncbi:MAG: hypothetical protein J2P45_24575, partial [Candidatus Dormibacteraeota bacterium]|nr:hypothetical protein [Candidatus Dormibacteraeota bacterium]
QLIAGGLVAMIAVFVFSSLSSHDLPKAIGVALLILVADATVLFAPVPPRPSGRPIVEWAPILSAYVWRAFQGHNHWRSGAPQQGDLVVRRVGGQEMRLPEPRHLPPSLQGLEMLSITFEGAGERGFGVLKDRRTRTYTCCLVALGAAAALRDEDDQLRSQHGWAAAIGNFGRPDSPITRVQWIERAVPEEPDAMTGYLEEKAPKTLPSAYRSYRELLGWATPASQQHEILLALQLDPRRCLREAKREGQGDLDRGAAKILLREASEFVRQLGSVELEVLGVLDPSLYAREIRVAYDPDLRSRRSRIQLAGGERGVDPSRLGPVATNEMLQSFVSDSGWHRTYHVEQWPRTRVEPDFLASLLLQTTCLRTVSTVMEALPPKAGFRDSQTRMTGQALKGELRAKLRLIPTFQHAKEQTAAEQLDEELAEGHVGIRYSSYVTVTASSEAELDAAGSQVVQQAGAARLDLTPLVGQQEAAFTYTLPICRGLVRRGRL